jgi:hypothetical protein
MLIRIGAACGATLALLAATAIAKPAPPVADTQDVVLGFKKNSNPNSGSVGVTSPGSLAAGAWYVAEVQGTGSYHKPSMWLHPRTASGKPAVVCGTPEAAPLFNTSGAPTGKVGFDPETMFARVTKAKTCANDPLPRTTRRFQVNPAHVWRHPTPLTGRQTTPSADHRYEYAIKGVGVPVGFRQLDAPTYDNYGAFHIHLRRATDADCAGGRWRNFEDENGQHGFTSAANCEAAL